MPNDTLKKIAISDFSPGIMQKLNRLGGDTAMFPLGAADKTNTYRCIALPGGGLGPLPQRTVSYSRSPATPEAGAFASVFNGHVTISGAHMAGPIFAAGGAGFTRQELHIAYEWGFNVSGTQYTRKYTWERHRLWEATPGIDTIVGYASTAEGGTITAPQMRPTWFHTYRADASSQLAIGAPLVVGGWYAGGGGLAQRFWSTYPNPTTLTSDTPGPIRAASNPEGIFGHQGRSVELDQTTWSHGSVGTWSFNEQVFYTKVNLASLDNNSLAAVYGQEDAEGFGAFASVNASELMLVRIGYGGYIIRGDLNNPTVIFVPGIPGTGNSRHTAAITPVGLVYGSRNGGVWAWAGGDTADLLSPQLDNDFWLPGGQPNDFVDYAGKFAFWKEYILTPHNWLYDWRNKSWWRIEDSGVIDIVHWCQNTDSHVIYGAPGSVNNTQTVSLAGWDAGVPATSWSWESQALPLGDYRTAQPREVVIIAQGVGTVKFTLSGWDSQGNLVSENHTATWASASIPEAFRFPVNLNQLTHMRIRLEATATAAATPIVWEANIMYRPDTHLAPH